MCDWAHCSKSGSEYIDEIPAVRLLERSIVLCCYFARRGRFIETRCHGVWVWAARLAVMPSRDGSGVNGRSGPSHGMRMPRQTRDQRRVLGCPLLRAALALSSNEQCCPTGKLEES